MRPNNIPLHRILLGFMLVFSLAMLVKSGKLRRSPKGARPPPILMRVHHRAPKTVGRVTVGSRNSHLSAEHRPVRFDIRRRQVILDQTETAIFHAHPVQESEELYLADDVVDPPLFTKDDFVALAGAFRALSVSDHKRKGRSLLDPCTQPVDKFPKSRPC